MKNQENDMLGCGVTGAELIASKVGRKRFHEGIAAFDNKVSVPIIFREKFFQAGYKYASLLPLGD